MNEERIERAQVRAAVRTVSLTVTNEMDAALHALLTSDPQAERLPNHRVNQLVRAVAWHTTRPTATARLEELAATLMRLWTKVGPMHPQGQVYLLLARQLGMAHELQAVQAASQAEIARLDEQRAHLQARMNQVSRPEHLRGYRADLRHGEQQRSLLAAELHNVQAMRQALEAEAPGPDQPVPLRWEPQVRRMMRMGPERYDRWRPDIRLFLALVAVQVVQTAPRRHTMRAYLVQQAREMEQTV